MKKTVKKAARENADVRRKNIKKELWQLGFSDLSEIYVSLLCGKVTKEQLIKDLLEKVNYKDLETELIWYSSSC